MDDLLAALVEFLLEGILEFLVEVLFGLVVEAMAERWEKGSRTIPWILLALLGVASGFFSAAIFPHRIIVRRAVLPGISLLLAPVATGFAMHWIGNQLRRWGRPATGLATFQGGAAFAFAMALIRWWLVGVRQ
jgi:hypothetical protein